MEFDVKLVIFRILKWNFQNINAVNAGLYILPLIWVVSISPTGYCTLLWCVQGMQMVPY